MGRVSLSPDAARRVSRGQLKMSLLLPYVFLPATNWNIKRTEPSRKHCSAFLRIMDIFESAGFLIIYNTMLVSPENSILILNL